MKAIDYILMYLPEILYAIFAEVMILKVLDKAFPKSFDEFGCYGR